jgi:hypothetical protein
MSHNHFLIDDILSPPPLYQKGFKNLCMVKPDYCEMTGISFFYTVETWAIMVRHYEQIVLSCSQVLKKGVFKVVSCSSTCTPILPALMGH